MIQATPRRLRSSLAQVLLWVVLLVPAASGAEPVSFETADGFVLHGELRAAPDEKAPVAILLHMYRSDRRAFAPLLEKLSAAGFTVLALDQRAHGESTRKGSETVRVEQLSRRQFSSLVRQGPEDVKAARRYLAGRGVGVDRIGLVGASYGCTVSLLSAGQVDGVRTLVLLSPGTAYFGVDVLETTRGFEGPLLAVAAEDDPDSAESARQIVAAHPGRGEIEVYTSGGHGTRLFAPRPELMKRVVEFLRTALGSG